MVSKIITKNTLENFLAGVVILSLQHQVFCVTSTATLQFLSVTDELQQSNCCVMSLSFLLECWEMKGCCCKKDDYIFWFWNDSA